MSGEEARTRAERQAATPVSRLRLTAVGALLLVLGITTLGGLLDGLLGIGYGSLTGVIFVIACLIAVVKTRPRDLLVLAVTPPLLFVIAVALAETIHSWGADNWFRQTAVAVSIALAGNAVWIAVGSTATALTAAGRAVRMAAQRSGHPPPRSPSRGGATTPPLSDQRSAASAARKS